MDFSLSPELLDLQQRARAFIHDKILPMEGDKRQTPHGPTEELRQELVALGREAGFTAPHVGVEWGGLGLNHVAKAIVFEEAGYSLLGPIAMHIFAPFDADMRGGESRFPAKRHEFLAQFLRGAVRGLAFVALHGDDLVLDEGAGALLQVQQFGREGKIHQNARPWAISWVNCRMPVPIAVSGAYRGSVVAPER